MFPGAGVVEAAHHGAGRRFRRGLRAPRPDPGGDVCRALLRLGGRRRRARDLRQALRHARAAQQRRDADHSLPARPVRVPGDDQRERRAPGGAARPLRFAPPLWPCVMLTAEHCEEVARRLAKITPALLDEALLPDWEYQAEHKLPVIPEPLGFVSLGRSAKRADPVATMGFATLMVLLTLAVIVLFVLDKPWVPG